MCAWYMNVARRIVRKIEIHIYSYIADCHIWPTGGVHQATTVIHISNLPGSFLELQMDTMTAIESVVYSQRARNSNMMNNYYLRSWCCAVAKPFLSFVLVFFLGMGCTLFAECRCIDHNQFYKSTFKSKAQSLSKEQDVAITHDFAVYSLSACDME